MMMMLLVIVGGWGRFCCRFLLLSWMRSGRALALLELGYVWLKHRNPAGKTWRLLHRSKLLWEQLVADLVAMLGFFCSAFARGQDNRDKGKRRRSSRSRHGRRTCRRSISKSRSG
nr:uncharacterized protein LOC112275937 isoform X2 [Physcomitrium patens]|eukprot:XP_024362506.1 uncharacterized protein LOC112275937 isoform X2 [Physcomitrella patens]